MVIIFALEGEARAFSSVFQMSREVGRLMTKGSTSIMRDDIMVLISNWSY